MNADPHHDQRVYIAGAPLAQASAAAVLLHGRGAPAQDILSLAEAVGQPALGQPAPGQPAFAYLAPQAAGYTWYPERFLAPLEGNEPWLSSALALVGRVVEQVAAAGVPAERTLILGFSQGACLALEWAARNARRWGGVAGLTGSLIGPPGLPRAYPGSLAGTPIFLGCSDVDFHIPKERVTYTAEVLQALGGRVTTRLYPGMGHTINADEIEFVKGMMGEMLGPATATG